MRKIPRLIAAKSGQVLLKSIKDWGNFAKVLGRQFILFFAGGQCALMSHTQ